MVFQKTLTCRGEVIGVCKERWVIRGGGVSIILGVVRLSNTRNSLLASINKYRTCTYTRYGLILDLSSRFVRDQYRSQTFE